MSYKMMIFVMENQLDTQSVVGCKTAHAGMENFDLIQRIVEVF